MHTITKFDRQHKELNRINKYLQRAANKAKEFLKNNLQIMVSNSDKGGVTIISKKAEYYNKIRTLLSSFEPFTPLDKDPTKAIKGKLNRFLDKLYHANYISDELIDTINTAAFKMSRFLATILRKSFKPKYGVKCFQYFIKLVRSKWITIGNVLASYDVVTCNINS